MSQQLYLNLETSRHGQIAGSVSRAGFEDLIQVFSSEHEVRTTAAGAGGRRASAKKQHGPFRIIKGVDKATVLLYDAWSTNDRVDHFKLDVYQDNSAGVLSLFYSVELQNAKITSIRQQLADTSFSNDTPVEEISFEYSEIVWLFAEGNLQATDAAVRGG
ncbi:Hcp family type VI secretion system effector [Algoriphagus namhaensis]